MKLPNGDRAIVDERKLREYLLSTVHPVGRFKAAFFGQLGLTAANWETLQTQLATLASTGEAELDEITEFGRKYLISGTLTGSQGATRTIVSVWIILDGEDDPRLVTVYPR